MIPRDQLRNRILSFLDRLQVLLDPECKMSPEDAYLEHEMMEREAIECLRLLDSSSGEVKRLRSAGALQ